VISGWVALLGSLFSPRPARAAASWRRERWPCNVGNAVGLVGGVGLQQFPRNGQPSSRQGTTFRSCRRISFVCYLMFLVFASWASGTYWCGTYWYRRTAQGGPDQQDRRPVAAKAAHPSPVAQPALRRQPSKVGAGRMRECRTSGSIRVCPVMGIPTAIGISFNSMVGSFRDTRLIDDFPQPVHSTHRTMFSERMPRIE